MICIRQVNAAESEGQDIFIWLGDFAEVFLKDLAENLFLYREGINLEIELAKDFKLCIGSIYKISSAKSKILWEYLQKNLKWGQIRTSKSPIGVLVLFAIKKDEGLRVCVDFQDVNKVSAKNIYLLLRIDKYINALVRVL